MRPFHPEFIKIEDFTQALRITPNYSQAYHDLGLTYAQEEHYDKAIEYYTQAIKFDPNYPSFVKLRKHLQFIDSATVVDQSIEVIFNNMK
ncbi:tetratricopeptide repeat protein [Geminocystis sp. GBBB08]|uniref:tetratricopeptide repeat protein n=1 Tax=Geminocystis sp. GBBB08 TaxID=2604140 RepID=UPI0027E2382E|nr:tetratricopeptide repeat protein [Geminocystis sp. GBBB08]MBL1210824.1 tetratricopeptide repeat protein [Geminocystis sp. GBBB08]